MTPQEELDLINTAIRTLLSGGAVSAWSEGGHSVKHMSLSELTARKQQLENEIFQAETGGGVFMVREVEL